LLGYIRRQRESFSQFLIYLPSDIACLQAALFKDPPLQAGIFILKYGTGSLLLSKYSFINEPKKPGLEGFLDLLEPELQLEPDSVTYA
jgi:hypothetical protein